MLDAPVLNIQAKSHASSFSTLTMLVGVAAVGFAYHDTSNPSPNPYPNPNPNPNPNPDPNPNPSPNPNPHPHLNQVEVKLLSAGRGTSDASLLSAATPVGMVRPARVLGDSVASW